VAREKRKYQKMNIRWDSVGRIFIAELTSGESWQSGLDAVKAAGFRTTGPPEWLWYAPPPGIKALERLRAKKPASGLTITPEAFAVYRPLAEQDAKNAEVRKAAAELNKANKKQKKKVEQEATASELMPAEKEYITAADLPPMPPSENRYTPPAPPTTLCFICLSPLYFYELPDICIFCEKSA
jgi:hypothetical protein